MLELEVNDFSLDMSINSGQFFRYEKELDNSYTILLPDRAVNILQNENKLIVKSNVEKGLKEAIESFFDLNTDYTEIMNNILKLDPSLKDILNSSVGFKVLNMSPFETILSYIISANNSVPNIRNCVNNLSMQYGEKVLFNKKTYYLFPSTKSLAKITIEELNSMKLGFRSRYIYEIINKINIGDFKFNIISDLNTNDAMEYLLKEKGIGLKVASCILLFAYKRYDVFPIDTWVKKIMFELYQIDEVKAIKKYSEEHFKEYSGIVIQFLFNYKRNTKTNHILIEN